MPLACLPAVAFRGQVRLRRGAGAAPIAATAAGTALSGRNRAAGRPASVARLSARALRRRPAALPAVGPPRPIFRRARSYGCEVVRGKGCACPVRAAARAVALVPQRDCGCAPPDRAPARSCAPILPPPAPCGLMDRGAAVRPACLRPSLPPCRSCAGHHSRRLSAVPDPTCRAAGRPSEPCAPLIFRRLPRLACGPGRPAGCQDRELAPLSAVPPQGRPAALRRVGERGGPVRPCAAAATCPARPASWTAARS